MKRYRIAFEKWRSPYAQDKTEVEIIEDLSKQVNFNKQDDSEDWNNEEDENHDQIPQQVSAILTPLGLVPLNEYTNPERVFNFWTLHTNFNISQRISDIIENVDGVEILRIFTAYRGRFAVGELYTPKNVFVDIQKSVLNFLKANKSFSLLFKPKK